MIRTIFLALSLLLVGGCAATDSRQTTADAQEICTREYRVGSIIPVVNCEVPMTEEERRRMIDDVRNSVRPIPTATGAGQNGG